jgi:hypothetical protein
VGCDWGMMGKRCWRGGVWNGVGRGRMEWKWVEMGVKGEAGGGWKTTLLMASC